VGTTGCFAGDKAVGA